MKSLKKYGISINGIQDLFPGLKAQGNDPIVEWRKLQNIGVRPRDTHPYKDTHPSPPPLSMANFRLEQSPAPLRGTGSRAQVVHWVELDYSQFCSTSHTSSGYSHSERWHSISQVPFWVAGDLSGRVTALGCYLAYIATDSYYASCGRWVYSRAYIFLPKMSLSKIFFYSVSVSLQDLSLVIVNHPVGYIPFVHVYPILNIDVPVFYTVCQPLVYGLPCMPCMLKSCTLLLCAGQSLYR